jgi:hypothetical protein
MLRRFRNPLLALLLMLLIVVPAAAAERVDSLPAIKGYSSVRTEQVTLINGQPFMVAKMEAASGERLHGVLKALNEDGSVDEVLELVIYDGAIYTRENDNPQWYIENFESTPAPAPVPDAPAEDVDAEELPITFIGSMPIAGVMTDQYQIWINSGDPTLYAKIDLWIGQAVNYPYQLQISIIGEDPDFGDLAIESVSRLYDHDATNIVVGPPTNAIPRPDDGSSPFFNRGRSLAELSPVLALPTVHRWAVERFAR